jgi:hypothetical protein
MSIVLSHHARVRMQQRGIPREALTMLFEIGRVGPASGGCQVVFIDKHERRRLCRSDEPRVRARDQVSSLYAVTDDHGTVITVGHRYRPLGRRGR